MPAEAKQVDIMMLREAIARTLGIPLDQLAGFVLITIDDNDMTGLLHNAVDVSSACDVASQVFAAIPHGHGDLHNP